MNTEKSTLKALLVAVDDYPRPEHKLKGCVNDLEDVTQFLKTWHDLDKVTLDLLVLKNQHATRANIVNAFSTHFAFLKPGDIALFYFSGHGYSGVAPEEYWHFTPSRKYETIVCYDSRTDGGRDLADKELSYLIYKVMKQNGVKFTAILDCCHSGSALRDTLGDEDGPFERDEDEDATKYTMNDLALIREVKSVGKQNTKIAFLGQEEHVHHNGNTTVPYGRHVLLSSCRDYEKAREITFNGKRRGVFTYCLLQALRKSNGMLTYNQLIARTKAQTAYYNQNQHPQLVITHEEDAGDSFLGVSMIEKSNWKLAYYHATHGWRVDFGMIHGLSLSNENCDGGTLQLFEETTPYNELVAKANPSCVATITGIYSNYSTLSLSKKMEESKQFKAIFLLLPVPKLKIGLMLDGSDLNNYKVINAVNEIGPQHFMIVGEIDQATHVIRFYEEQLAFCQKEQDRKLIATGNENLEEALHLFLNYVETYARWNTIKGISNPLNTFNPADIEFEFTVVTTATRDHLDVIEEVALDNFLSTDIVLPYQPKAGELNAANQWEEPMFRLKIKNTSNEKRFWCSLLYIGSDFSISNELMPSIALGPREECWAESDDPNHRCKTSLIPMHIEDEYLTQGIFKIKEHFKIIVSTEQFDTYAFNQCGIPLGEMNMNDLRALNRPSNGIGGDFVQWAVFDFALKVVLPQRESS